MHPVGWGPGLTWHRQRDCRLDVVPRRSQVTAQQKARGSRSPRAGTRTRGASTGPWQTPSPLPGLAGVEEPQRRARQPRRGARHHSGQLPAHFLPACGPCQRSAPRHPCPSSARSLRPSRASCQCKASCRGREPALGMPLCHTPAKGTREGQRRPGGVPQRQRCTHRFGSLHLLPLPSAAGVRRRSAASSSSSSSPAQPRGCLCRKAPSPGKRRAILIRHLPPSQRD